MKTQKEKELLETLRKWEDLCHEGLADTAYWKVQAMELHGALTETLAELAEYMKICPNEKCLDLSGVIANARSALAKAEGRE